MMTTSTQTESGKSVAPEWKERERNQLKQSFEVESAFRGEWQESL